MITLHVMLKVEQADVEQFRELTVANARASREEVGNVRYEVLQSEDDDTVFYLIEQYKDDEAFNAHFATDHFKLWNTSTKDMIVESNGGKVTILD